MSYIGRKPANVYQDIHHLGPPPDYTEDNRDDPFQSPSRDARSAWHPKNWTWRLWATVIAVVVVIIVAIVLGAVLGSRASSGSYPDYSPLNYTLRDTYSGSEFFDDFEYFTGYDPTGGFVHYVPREQALQPQLNLTYAGQDSAVLRVDTSEQNADTGRYSVRITSNQQYNSGLFIFDVVNVPYGCSTWPALWLSDPNNWPEHGEIDILETVNQATTGAQTTLHTAPGCKMQNNPRNQSASILSNTCNANKDDNGGCGVEGVPASAGAQLNTDGGGVYAMEWRSDGIRVWFFPRADIPDSVPSSNNTPTDAPDPSQWPQPVADFPNTDCDIDSHFQNMSIIANIALCGDWAGAESVYSGEDDCPGSCHDFVAQNAQAFEQARWEWGGWWVYAAD